MKMTYKALISDLTQLLERDDYGSFHEKGIKQAIAIIKNYKELKYDMKEILDKINKTKNNLASIPKTRIGTISYYKVEDVNKIISELEVDKYLL